ncbi:MAG TPA: PqiC family protein [Vicinamibacterales bacterium]
MAGRTAHLMVSIALVTAASGCGTTAPSRFYTLDPTALSDGAAPVSYPIMVGPVSVPAAVDRPEFVLQSAPNRVEVDEFDRWAAPLNDAVAQVVAGDLVKLLGTPNVASAPMANFVPAYRVTIDIQRFDSVPSQAALVEAVWTVHSTAGGETRSGRTVAREAVQGDGFDALAAAHSRALAKMSGDIAGTIRAEADDQQSDKQ